jgi:glycosyltransferase involved in cell wall biosynthesis
VSNDGPTELDTYRGGTLWIISELYFPEMTSTGYYLTKIAEGLSPDQKVSVICGQPNYSAKGTIAPKKESLNGVDVFRVFGTRLDKNVIPFRIINMLTLSISVFLRCVFSFRSGDQVLVVTNPPLLPFLTATASRIRGAKHILLIHDCYPEILYAAGKLKEGTLFARFLEAMSKGLINSADLLIVVGRDMRESVLTKIGVAKDCVVIPNWAELETVSPTERNENPLLEDLGLKDKFVFLYAGNMGYPNDIETFIEAASDLDKTDSPAHFVFLGAGVKKSLLETAVKTLKLKNISILESRPRAEQQVFLNACDVGVVSLVEKMRGVSMPSRTYNILAAGKPILALCDPGSEIAKVVIEEEAGWVIGPNDSKSLKNAILKIVEDPSLLRKYGENGRRAALEKYSLEMAVSKYEEAIKNGDS